MKYLENLQSTITAAAATPNGLAVLAVLLVVILATPVLRGKPPAIQIPLYAFSVLLIMGCCFWLAFDQSHLARIQAIDQLSPITQQERRVFKFKFPVRRAAVEMIDNCQDVKRYFVNDLNDGDNKIEVVIDLHGTGPNNAGRVRYRVWGFSM